MEEIGIPLPENSEYFVEKNILYFKKWNMPYEEFLKFQKEAQELVRLKKLDRVYIFTNHPHCFTLGRGNERGEKQLVETSEEQLKNLSLPLHRIHRGGGLTYHYPGQWIFYPIVRITQNHTLHDHMCWLLKLVRNYLNQQYDLNAIATEKIMGVWINKKKIASIGVGLQKFVTEHGLAFNLNSDELMSQELAKIFPCGLNSNTYVFLNELLDKKELDLEKFHQSIVKTMI